MISYVLVIFDMAFTYIRNIMHAYLPFEFLLTQGCMCYMQVCLYVLSIHGVAVHNVHLH